jgi:YegS/Rv2252/BmrU family lipid kinase
MVVGRRRQGRPIAQQVAEVAGILREGGWRVDDAVVSRKGELRQLARRAVRHGADVVVAVGGDGAVLQVATGLAGSRTALGIIPLGTGNLLAGNLRLPTSPAKAARLLLTGRRRRIDVGRITVDGKERCFTVACGVGFDAEVMDATETTQKLHWGKLAYLANAVGQSDEVRNVVHTITIDGERMKTRASQVFVANFGRMLPIVSPRRPIRPNDARLDVIIIQAAGPLPGLLAGWEAITQGELGESRGGHVFRAQASKVRIETKPRRLVEVDGSVIGSTPVKIRVRPAALTVVVR